MKPTISLLILFVSFSAVAQTTSGSIAGSVTDPQHALVANATVTASDETKGFSQTVPTDKEGRFVFTTLSPGTYTILVESPGFSKLQKTGVVLVANDKLSLGEMPLEVGVTVETVSVTAEATLLQT